MDPQQNPSDSVLNQLSGVPAVGSPPVSTQPSVPVVPVGSGIQAALGTVSQPFPSSLPPTPPVNGASPTTPLPEDSSQKRNILFALIGVVVLVVLAAGWYLWQSQQTVDTTPATQKTMTQKKLADEAPPSLTGDREVDLYASGSVPMIEVYQYLDSRFIEDNEAAYLLRGSDSKWGDVVNGVAKIKDLGSSTVVWVSLPVHKDLPPATQNLYSLIAIPVNSGESVDKKEMLKSAAVIGEFSEVSTQDGEKMLMSVKFNNFASLLNNGQDWMIGVMRYGKDTPDQAEILYHGYPATATEQKDGSYLYEIIPVKEQK